MITIRFYVGEGFKAHEWVRFMIRTRLIGGATIQEADGFWRNPDTTKVEVEKAHVVILALEYLRIPGIIEHARGWAHAKQEHSVMVERLGEVTFYKARP